MAKLLVVDDEKNIRLTLTTLFESAGHQVTTAEKAQEALAFLAREGNFDLVLSDYRMAEVNGLELLQQIKRESPNLPVILMTAYATVENAVAALKSGATDYITKPFTLDQIQHVVDRALEVQNLRAENRVLWDAVGDQPLLESHNPSMRRLFETARQAAASEATILLIGESGTGKNVLARQIHKWSPRSGGPFVVVNCTTLSEHLLESSLAICVGFHRSFQNRPGLVEKQDRGTVFLDEIAGLTPALQTRFLRFVQETALNGSGKPHDFKSMPHYRCFKSRYYGGSGGSSFS